MRPSAAQIEQTANFCGAAVRLGYDFWPRCTRHVLAGVMIRDLVLISRDDQAGYYPHVYGKYGSRLQRECAAHSMNPQRLRSRS